MCAVGCGLLIPCMEGLRSLSRLISVLGVTKHKWGPLSAAL